MSAALVSAVTPINTVCIYAGTGSYGNSVEKRIEMFKIINIIRESQDLPAWTILPVAGGERLIGVLKALPAKETLLVVPAGESTQLDASFTAAQTDFIMNEFLMKGGRGYFNCGAAYWASKLRIYTDICQVQPKDAVPIAKTTKLPLFPGTAVGPLCPYPGKEYKAGFYSDAVTVTNGEKSCTVYLSGGGSFLLPKPEETKEKIVVVARYLHSELTRLGKSAAECEKWQNAACMSSVGQGAALLTMFHPYYRPEDFDVKKYEAQFPNSGTDWSKVKARLSTGHELMSFALQMISRLDKMNFNEMTAGPAASTAVAKK